MNPLQSAPDFFLRTNTASIQRFAPVNNEAAAVSRNQYSDPFVGRTRLAGNSGASVPSNTLCNKVLNINS